MCRIHLGPQSKTTLESDRQLTMMLLVVYPKSVYYKKEARIAKLQWRSKIWTSLDFDWSKRGWVANGLDGIWNLKAQPFEIQRNCCHFVKSYLKSEQKCLNFKWSSFCMVGNIAIAISKAWPFENQTILNPTFKMSGFQMFLDFKWSNFRSPL